jgi:hypothetical protein
MPIHAMTSLPGRRKRLLRLGSIGRETFVVVSLGSLIAAAALLPRVVGEPGLRRLTLPPPPTGKSASVTAPIYELSPPRRPQHPKQIVSNISPRVPSSPSPSSREAIPAQPTVAQVPGIPAKPQRTAAPRAQPVSQTPSQPTPHSGPVTQPQAPAQPPAVLPAPAVSPPSPVVLQPEPAPEPQTIVTPAGTHTLLVGLSDQSGAPTHQATQQLQVPAAQTSDDDDSSKNPRRAYGRNRENGQAHEPGATPCPAPSPATFGRGKPAQSSHDDGSDSLPPGHDGQHGDDQHVGPTNGESANGAASTTSSEQAATPQPDPEQSVSLSVAPSTAQSPPESSGEAPVDTDSDHHDGGRGGGHGHGNGGA